MVRDAAECPEKNLAIDFPPQREQRVEGTLVANFAQHAHGVMSHLPGGVPKCRHERRHRLRAELDQRARRVLGDLQVRIPQRGHERRDGARVLDLAERPRGDIAARVPRLERGNQRFDGFFRPAPAELPGRRLGDGVISRRERADQLLLSGRAEGVDRGPRLLEHGRIGVGEAADQIADGLPVPRLGGGDHFIERPLLLHAAARRDENDRQQGGEPCTAFFGRREAHDAMRYQILCIVMLTFGRSSPSLT